MYTEYTVFIVYILQYRGLVGIKAQCFPVMWFFYVRYVRVLNTRQWTSLHVLTTPYVYVRKKYVYIQCIVYIYTLYTLYTCIYCMYILTLIYFLVCLKCI